MFGLLAPGTGTQLAEALARASIPRHVESVLLADARREATRDGDRHPYDIEAISTTFRASVRVTCDECESEVLPAGTPVYVVAMRGHFSCNTCSPPRGRTVRPGTVVTLVYIAATMFRTSFGLGHAYPNLRTAGTPVRLDAPSARRRHR